MNLMNKLRPFGDPLRRLSVIATDLTEGEAFVKTLAEVEKRRSPRTFAADGKADCVYFKLPYVPPCEPFHELRRLILRVRENTGLRANFRGAVAIEVNEWLGHESEEYFTVLLKYLYDHRSIWNIGLVLNHRDPEKIKRLLFQCSKYITPCLYEFPVFDHPETLCALLRYEFFHQKGSICPEATELLATALARKELNNYRSLTLLERTAEELSLRCREDQSLGAEAVRAYLSDPDTTLTMMAGMPLLNERSVPCEKEKL